VIGVHLALACVAVLWGLNFSTTKILLAHWDPYGLLAARFLCIFPLAVGWALAVGARPRIARRDLVPLFWAGACGIAGYQLCFVLSLSRTTIFASALFSCLFPLFTLVIAALMRTERPRPLRWGGALLAFAGLAIFEGVLAGRAAFRPGDLFALGAAVAFTPYALVIRRLSSRYGPLELLVLTLAFGTAVLVLAGFNGLVHQDFSRLDGRDWLVFAYIVLFPVLICYAVFNWGIARIGAGPASMYAMSVPIAGGIIGALIFHTDVPLYEWIGALVSVAGLLVVQLAGDRPAARPG
jgi:drug/metabolite transporter (DMT)-like permease